MSNRDKLRRRWISLSLRRCFLLGLAFVAPSTLEASPYEVAGLQLDVTVAPEKPQIMVGEPCRLYFKVANRSQQNLGILVGGDYRNGLGRPISFKIVTKGADGKKVPQPDPGETLGGMMGPQKLPAGGNYVFTLYLEDWATFTKPDQYTIEVRRKLRLVPDVRRDDFWRNTNDVDVTLNTKIFVVPSDAVKLGKIIAELGAKILDDNSDLAGQAQKMLSAIHDERVIPYYIKLAKKPNSGDRYEACKSLGEYKNDEAFNTLVALMKTTGEELRESTTTLKLADASAGGVRHGAAIALSRSPHPRAIPFLWTCAADPNYAVRLTVVQKAGELMTPEARSIIAKLTTDENEMVRSEALRYQKELAEKDAHPGSHKPRVQAQPNKNEVNLPQDATDEDLSELENKERITILRLEGMYGEAAGPYITDAGLVHLEPMKQLQELWLDGIPFTDAGMLHLRGLTNLRVLRFHNAPLTDAGLQNFKDMHNLECLLLGYSRITDQGMRIIGGLKKLKTLDLRTQVTDAGLVHLEGLSGLNWLCLSGMMVGDKGVASLAKLRELDSLYLDQTKVSDEGLRLIKTLPNLKTLDLTGTNITDAGMEHLAVMKSLESLKLNETKVTDRGLLQLKSLRNLKELEVHQTKVTAEGIAQLKQALPTLQVIAHQN